MSIFILILCWLKKKMNATSAFHTTLDIIGKQYGYGSHVFNMVAEAYLGFFVTLFGYSLSCIYFMGPAIPWTKLGFWESRSSIDICSQSSNLPPEYWFGHRDECDALVYGLFENFVIVLASFLWCICIISAGLWATKLAYTQISLVFPAAAAKRRSKRGSMGRRMQIEYTVAPFPALATEVLPKFIATNDKRFQVHDAIKIKNSVGNLGGADCVVED